LRLEWQKTKQVEREISRNALWLWLISSCIGWLNLIIVKYPSGFVSLRDEVAYTILHMTLYLFTT